MTKAYNITDLKERRKNLRKEATEQENLLWWHIRGKRIGSKFRRQHSIGGYILDFYCPEKKLIIEIDGGIHNKTNNQLNDRIRDKFFTDLDYKILRFTNDQIENKITEVIHKIKENL